jgi:hypothetical protein
MLAIQHFESSPTWCEDCYTFSESLAELGPKAESAELVKLILEKTSEWEKDAAREEDLWQMDFAVWRRIFGLHKLATKEAFEYYILKGIFREWEQSPYGDWLTNYGFDEDELRDMADVLEAIVKHPHFSDSEFSLLEIARLRHMGQGVWMGMCQKCDLGACNRCMPIVTEIAAKHQISL